FARVTPGGWRGMRKAGAFTVADVENLGRLYFDTATEEWIFETTKIVRARFPEIANGTTIVCASYELPSSRNGKLILRAVDPKSGARQTISKSTTKRLRKTPGKIRIGSSREGKDYWNGNLRHFVVSPGGMSANKWNAIASVPDAAPNPLNRGALDRALL